MPGIPAVGQNRPDSITALNNRIRDIIALIIQALIIIGPTRSKVIASDAVAVYSQFIQSQSGRIRCRMFNRLVYHKILPEIRWRRQDQSIVFHVAPRHIAAVGGLFDIDPCLVFEIFVLPAVIPISGCFPGTVDANNH